MRNYQGSSFSIAGEENGPILDGIGPFQATVPVTTSAFSGCPAQQGSANTPANFNRDGTIKIPRCVPPAVLCAPLLPLKRWRRSCGYCLSAAAARMQAGALPLPSSAPLFRVLRDFRCCAAAVPALVAVSAALLLLSSLCLLLAPRITSHKHFPVFFGVVFCAVPIVLCAAAVGGAAATFPQQSACAISISFGSASFMTSQLNSSLASWWASPPALKNCNNRPGSAQPTSRSRRSSLLRESCCSLPAAPRCSSPL
jgi:hypothetical protein